MDDKELYRMQMAIEKISSDLETLIRVVNRIDARVIVLTGKASDLRKALYNWHTDYQNGLTDLAYQPLIDVLKEED